MKIKKVNVDLSPLGIMRQHGNDYEYMLEYLRCMTADLRVALRRQYKAEDEVKRLKAIIAANCSNEATRTAGESDR